MSVSRFYAERFGTNTDQDDIGSAIAEIELVHLNVAKLLDLILDAADNKLMDVEHVYATVKGSISLLASLDPQIAAIHAFNRKAAPLMRQRATAPIAMDRAA